MWRLQRARSGQMRAGGRTVACSGAGSSGKCGASCVGSPWAAGSFRDAGASACDGRFGGAGFGARGGACVWLAGLFARPADLLPRRACLFS
jgi:hypothetical protein